MPRTDQGFSVGEHDWHSPDYVEAWIARDGGRDAERRQRLAEMLAHAGIASPAAIAVLDVGGGFGVVTEEVLRAFPQAQVTLQDYSQPMLDEARRRLARYQGQVGYVMADLFDPRWTERVGGPFDLAVSAIAIHNLRDMTAIAAAYHGIAGVLKPGARFLDYDLFFDRTGGVPRHMQLLHEAGFGRVDCIWQDPPRATLVASIAG